MEGGSRRLDAVRSFAASSQVDGRQEKKKEENGLSFRNWGGGEGTDRLFSR